MIRALLCFFAFCLYMTVSSAQNLIESNVTKIAVYPKDILDTDYNAGKYKVVFDVLYQTKNAQFKPDSFKILDSSDVTSSNLSMDLKSGEYLVSQQYTATIDQDYDLENYPFDSQSFVIALSAPESNNLRSYFAKNLSAYTPDIQMDDWRYVKFDITESVVTASQTLDNKHYINSPQSVINFEYSFKHQDWRTYINLFSAFFLCALFAVLVFAFDDFDIKFQLLLAAIFGFIGNKYIVDSTIPVSTSFTLSDKIQLATFLVILISAFCVIIEQKVSEDSRLKVRIVSAIFTTFTYLSAILYCTFAAVNV